MWRLTGVVWAQAWFRLADPGEIDQYRQLCRKSVPDQLFMFRFGSIRDTKARPPNVHFTPESGHPVRLLRPPHHSDGTKHVCAQYSAIVHFDRRVPVNLHAIPNLTLRSFHGPGHSTGRMIVARDLQQHEQLSANLDECHCLNEVRKPPCLLVTHFGSRASKFAVAHNIFCIMM